MSASRTRFADHPEIGEIPLQQVLEALVDPVRRSVVRTLFEAEAAISCGAFELPVSKATATHHFRVLREAGLIRQTYVGTSRMDTLRREELEAAFPGLITALVTGPASPPAEPNS